MTHFKATNDVIGHDVTLHLDISNVRDRNYLQGKVHKYCMTSCRFMNDSFLPNIAQKLLILKNDPEIRGGELRKVSLNLMNFIKKSVNSKTCCCLKMRSLGHVINLSIKAK